MASNLKQKIAQIKAECDAAVQRAEKAEKKLRGETEHLEEAERQLDEYNRRIQVLEGDLDEIESK